MSSEIACDHSVMAGAKSAAIGHDEVVDHDVELRTANTTPGFDMVAAHLRRNETTRYGAPGVKWRRGDDLIILDQPKPATQYG